MTTRRVHSSKVEEGGEEWWKQPVSESQHNKRKRLVLLHHAAKCTAAEGHCKIAHCSEMKRIWRHIASSKCKGANCDFPHCVYSRIVLSHYRRCMDQSCVVCGPVRATDSAQVVSRKRSATSAGFQQDPAPNCRMCHQEGKAELVRDCSCRGRSGLAHLSSIVTAAENRIRQAPDWNRMMVTREAFTICPICDEDYQSELRSDLLKARVTFVEKEYKSDHMLRLHALVDRMRDIVERRSEQDSDEGEAICSKILKVIKKIRKSNNQNNAFMMNVATAYSVMEAFHREERKIIMKSQER